MRLRHFSPTNVSKNSFILLIIMVILFYSLTKTVRRTQISVLIHVSGMGVFTVAFTLPPATSPDSPSWMATPNPPNFTGAEFSLDASSTQWGWERERREERGDSWSNGPILLIKEWHPPINNKKITYARHTQTITHHCHTQITNSLRRSQEKNEWYAS